MREDRFRTAAKSRRTLFNAWLTLNNPFLIELIGEAGWDCITIDQQHGLGGNEALFGCLTAARACGLPAIVRVAENDGGLIGRALDAGAQGIMCPLIGNVEDAEAFVQAVKYPPRGNRSWGPYRARLGHDGDYFKTANDWTIACPQIETKGALDQLDEILGLDGVDMVCFGPNDLSVALTGRLDIHAPEVKDAMTSGSQQMPRDVCHRVNFCQRRRVCQATGRRSLGRGGGRHRCRLVLASRRGCEARRRHRAVNSADRNRRMRGLVTE